MSSMQLINSFVPFACQKNPDRNRRARLLIQLTLFIACAAVVFAGVYYLLGFSSGSIGLLIALVAAIINLIIFKTTGAIDIAANIVIMIMLTVLTYLSINIGGIEASSLYWLIAIPLLSIILLDKKWVLVWTLVVELVILTLYVTEQTGFHISVQKLSAPANQFTHFSGLSGLVIVIVGITLLTHRITSETLNESRIEAENVADHLKTVFDNVEKGTEILLTASSGLSSISQQITAGAEKTLSKTETAVARSDDMLNKVNEATEIMGASSTSLENVVLSADQMTATINEIASNTENARNITEKAVLEARNTSAEVAELGNAAVDINKVTETISEISEQTNLLALNATIEAARAGDAGKGFAVVASEIKDLARQTTDATQAIKQRIEGVQQSTKGTVERIVNISKVINDVHETVNIISAAVEEQSVTTKEIARNLKQTCDSIQNANTTVSDCSLAVRDIATNFSDVNQQAREMSDSSEQLNVSAEDLLTLADQLKERVVQYKN